MSGESLLAHPNDGRTMTKNEYSELTAFLIFSKLKDISTNQVELTELAEQFQTRGEVLLLQIGRYYGLKCKLARVTPKKWKKKTVSTLPYLAKGKDGDFFLMLAYREESVVALFPAETTPRVLSQEELWEIWEGDGIWMVKKGESASEQARFSFRWFIPTILKFKKEFVQVLLAVFLVQCLGLLTPIMTQVIIDKVLSHRTLATLYVLALGIGLVYLFELILSLAKNYLFTHTTNRIDVLLSSKLFAHLFSLPLSYFESRRAGETVARVQELNHIRQFLTGTPLSTLIDDLFITVYLVVLFLYSTSLSWVVVASVPFYIILSLIVTPLFRKRLDEKFYAGAQTSSFLVESIQGVQTVKSFALEPKFESKWGELQADYVKASYKTAMLAGTSGTIAQYIQKMCDLIVLYIGAQMVMAGQFSVGQLVAFRMLSSRISGPVLRLVQLWQEYQQASLSVTRIGDIFNSPREVEASSAKGQVLRLQGSIEFDHITFRYRLNTPEILRQLSFSIEPGRMIGVVGRSGSGKSTIAKLIQGLYRPEMGRVRIDGMDTSLLDPKQLRKQIGVVLQENFIFNGTVRDNIAIHYPTASVEEVILAAKRAGAHDFILALPNGYDTIVGEKGQGLSGGQKQRLAIARAIIADPPILIFDEATSALDYESESIIQQNLKAICQGRTVIMIAHRLSTLRDVDAIMVIDNGRIDSFGCHEDLLKQKGLYASLYEKQVKGEVDVG